GSHFSEIELAKVKKRKTKNLSKKSRLTAKSGDLSTK
ncbi:TPA: adenine-specific DNA-methyltransferase, partial [Citrobacter freundii]|nr:adenine-specific DNA-methyltransferase [Citrobacter freundii]HEE9927163.1 adenine-specific DNA-methyltransferase [Citrobacter freundii]